MQFWNQIMIRSVWRHMLEKADNAGKEALRMTVKSSNESYYKSNV